MAATSSGVDIAHAMSEPISMVQDTLTSMPDNGAQAEHREREMLHTTIAEVEPKREYLVVPLDKMKNLALNPSAQNGPVQQQRQSATSRATKAVGKIFIRRSQDVTVANERTGQAASSLGPATAAEDDQRPLKRDRDDSPVPVPAPAPAPVPAPVAASPISAAAHARADNEVHDVAAGPSASPASPQQQG